MSISSHSSLQNNIILTDICSKSNKKVYFSSIKDVADPVVISSVNITSWNFLQYLSSVIKDIFLPKGYPDSVSSDYLEYQVWDTCQAFCSSISSTLTMRTVMQGIGVGSETATPVSAALTWIMKDGTGMIGSILFAWLIGSKLDSDCKKWRLFADILNDIAMFVELYIPFMIDYSMTMLCISTVFKAMVGTAGSSTRAALITHQAVKENIADVSAKDGSQEIFTNLCAFIFGIFLLKNVTETQQIWTVMCTATFFHLVFNYKAVRCLKMNVFNTQRFRLCLRTYLPTSVVPTIEQINKRESVFLFSGMSDVLICGFSVVFGVSVKKVIEEQNVTAFQLNSLTNLFECEKYLIIPCLKSKKLYITFRQHFEENDVLKAYFHGSLLAICICYLLEKEKKPLDVISRSRKNSPVFRLKNKLQQIVEKMEIPAADSEKFLILHSYKTCESFVDKEFAAFCKACKEQDWNVEKHLINIDDWRGDWINSEKEQVVIEKKLKPRVAQAKKPKPIKTSTSQQSKMRTLVIA